MFFFILCFILSNEALSQTKFEQEIRIRNESDVSQKAREFVDLLKFNRKVKWYQEIGINRTSIEAKTKFKGRRYSIEFTSNGLLEDVEIEVHISDLSQSSRSKIDEFLKSRHNSYYIEKVQIQYVGNQHSILDHLQNQTPLEGASINYELVIATKEERVFKSFEYLFSREGDYLESAEIVLENTDNIQY